jgi:hypothetical protein
MFKNAQHLILVAVLMSSCGFIQSTEINSTSDAIQLFCDQFNATYDDMDSSERERALSYLRSSSDDLGRGFALAWDAAMSGDSESLLLITDVCLARR